MKAERHEISKRLSLSLATQAARDFFTFRSRLDYQLYILRQVLPDFNALLVPIATSSNFSRHTIIKVSSLQRRIYTIVTRRKTLV